MKMKLISMGLIILFIIKIGLYATVIPLLIYVFCIVVLLKRSTQGSVGIILVSIISSIFDLYLGSINGFYGIVGALFLDIPTVILAIIYYRILMTSKKK